MRYAVVIEKAKRGYSAYVPDLPGCIATGQSRATVQRRIQQAIVLHLDGLRQDRMPIPKPRATAHYVSPQGKPAPARRTRPAA